MTTLNKVYCEPKTDAEWDSIPLYPESDEFRTIAPYVIDCVTWMGIQSTHTTGRTKVTVEQFLNLLYDEIVPWRLEEVGFVPFPDEHNTAMMRWENDAQYTVEVIGGGVYVNNASYNITTFTELLTLIKFLTPPTK